MMLRLGPRGCGAAKRVHDVFQGSCRFVCVERQLAKPLIHKTATI